MKEVIGVFEKEVETQKQARLLKKIATLVGIMLLLLLLAIVGTTYAVVHLSKEVSTLNQQVDSMNYPALVDPNTGETLRVSSGYLQVNPFAAPGNTSAPPPVMSTANIDAYRNGQLPAGMFTNGTTSTSTRRRLLQAVEEVDGEFLLYARGINPNEIIQGCRLALDGADSFPVHGAKAESGRVKHHKVDIVQSNMELCRKAVKGGNLANFDADIMIDGNESKILCPTADNCELWAGPFIKDDSVVGDSVNTTGINSTESEDAQGGRRLFQSEIIAAGSLINLTWKNAADLQACQENKDVCKELLVKFGCEGASIIFSPAGVACKIIASASGYGPSLQDMYNALNEAKAKCAKPEDCSFFEKAVNKVEQLAAAVGVAIVAYGELLKDLGEEIVEVYEAIAECFPANALVTTADGTQKRMDALRIGDKVLSIAKDGSTFFDDIYMFGHQDDTTTSNFVNLKSAGGATLRLTPDHYLPVRRSNSQLVIPASAVELGDLLLVASQHLQNMAEQPVVEKFISQERGLYNPYTLSGSIVVDGVAASSHSSSALDGLFNAMGVSIVDGYQMFLAPVRALYRMLGADAMIKYVEPLVAVGVSMMNGEITTEALFNSIFKCASSLVLVFGFKSAAAKAAGGMLMTMNIKASKA